MMRTLRLTLLAACLVAIAAGVDKPKLPTAAAILDCYVQVTGGAETYRRYGVVTVNSTVKPDDGTTYYETYSHVRDGGTLTEIDAGEASRQSGINGQIVWAFSEKKGARILSGKAADRELANARGLGEDDWRQRFPTAVTTGEQVINGRPCYRVKLTRTDKSTLERYYDEHSGLLLREVSTEFDDAGVEQPVTIDFDDYQYSLGIIHAKVKRVRIGNRTETIDINGVMYSPGGRGLAFEVPHEVAKAVAAQHNTGQFPNPVDLVDRFIEVSGGKSIYESIKTEVMKAEVSYKDQNLTVPVVMYGAPGKVYYSVDVPSMGKFEYGNDGHIAWEKSVVLGPRLAPPSAVGGLLGPGAGEILRWTGAAFNMETLSKQEVNGSPCYQVSMDGSRSPQPASTACFDVQTGYLVKTTQLVETEAGLTNEETIFSDYRGQENFKTAHHLETKLAGKLVTIDFKEITINGALPDGVFEPPADVKALAARRAVQQKNEVPVERPTLTRKHN